MRELANIYWLGVKELRSFLHDYVLLGLVFYSFSLAVVIQARSNSQELHNGSIAIVDEDRSALSRRIAHAFMPPLFQRPQMIAERDIVPMMNKGRYTFVIDIPANFEQDVLADADQGCKSTSTQPRWCRRASGLATRNRSSRPRSPTSSPIRRGFRCRLSISTC